jgi:osmotically-inducible protein OsmY
MIMTTTMMANDNTTRANVLDELKWDARVDDSDIQVHVNNGLVTLRGTVPAYAKKLAARDAAHRVAGVLDVVDEVRVQVPQLWQRSDEEIAEAARAALRWDVFVPDDRIRTTVASSTITLQGEVDNWTQRHDAERAVMHLAGVRGVINQIMVAAKPVSPDKIKEQIEHALERHTEREAKRIGVSVMDGVVTLTGTVASWGEKNVIDRVAGFAPGVRRVQDRLTVDPYC